MKEHGGLPTLYVVACLVCVSEALSGAQHGRHLEAAESVTAVNALWSRAAQASPNSVSDSQDCEKE